MVRQCIHQGVEVRKKEKKKYQTQNSAAVTVTHRGVMCVASLKVLLTSSDNILSQSSGVRFKSAQWVEKKCSE